MTHRLRCCEQPDNHVEAARVDGSCVSLYCRACGATLATSDDAGDLYADY